ncbi:hypothetical protein ACER0A_013760 [Haloimpatiens sp. FM7315]|uniref:hypothetical protein n=1 Tax=Haloimpatiens sp. FM7315 TaxID=3298609 RepID=UPI0035A28938
MIKKKNKFLTVLCSLLPGAGHMYMGFMKTGISFMAVFFTVIFLSSWLNIGPLLYILPLIWFYSFFDSTNRMSLEDEEFLSSEDKYLFSINKLGEINGNVFKKGNLVVGLLVLILGLYLTSNTIIDIIEPYVTSWVYYIIHDYMRQIPKIIVGLAIIFLGIKLIIGKRKEGKGQCLREEE